MSWDDAVDGVDRDTPGGRAPRAWDVARRLGRARRAPGYGPAANDDDRLPAYAELHCLSDFSFLRGASDAEALFARAVQCGYRALAITDECSLAGIVRALEASEATGLPLVVGSEFTLDDGLRCVLLVEHRGGYTRLCELITTARRAATKGRYRLTRADVERVLAAAGPQAMEGVQACGSGAGGIDGSSGPGPALPRQPHAPVERASGPLPTSGQHDLQTDADVVPSSAYGHQRVHASTNTNTNTNTSTNTNANANTNANTINALPIDGAADTGLFALWLPGADPDAAQGHWLRRVFGDRAWLAVELHRETDDAARLARLLALAGETGLPPLASGDVHMALRRERVLQDTLTAIRHTVTLAEAGALLFRNGERHLRSRRALGNIYPHALLQAAADLAARCRFSMREVKYVYPKELVPDGQTPASWLRHLTEKGMQQRWPHGVPAKVHAQIEDELALIAKLDYEAFFLTVEDIVRFAKGRGILCQGRGSSANSAVCFALGITVVNPAETRLLISRFLSEQRKEPPDIDVDFEHERREEVMQYVYNKYGRQRAALAATVISYRGKSAVRDVAKAFGLPPDQIGLLAECFGWGNGDTPMRQRLEEAGFDPDNPLVAKVLGLASMIEGHPRHLSQHVGGFVISDAPLSALVPVENAAMDDRTIIQWDKDDLETLGLLKVDCLALGMLTCIRKALDLVQRHRGFKPDIAQLPAEDEASTFAMMQVADTVGVFQIESRAQMSMLPRLKPAKFYDLVVQVAIVRPGPIQGGMVHPYLRRRMGKEPVDYPSDGVKEILGATLGIPLFQEQVMELVIHAGYTPDQADGLRRSMAAWKRGGDMEPHRVRIRGLMEAKGYSAGFIDQIFEQIKGFGSYGFPQSHAASFAKLVYISCWLKRHEPAAFACALLNAQPMGFYSASQIVQDARRGRGGRVGIEVRPVDVAHSDWDNTLEGGRRRTGQDDGGQPALRLGLRQLAGLSEAVAGRIMAARAQRAFADVPDLCLRAGLDAKARHALAEAGALASLAGHRNAARWAVAGIERPLPLLAGSPDEAPVALPAPQAGEEILSDYRATGLTLARHPMALLRARMTERRILGSRELQGRRHGSGVHVAGLVTQRQRPATAKGTIFVTLEDEHGMVNVIVWPHLATRRRLALLQSRLLAVRGRWEQVDGVCHLVAGDLHDLSDLLGSLQVDSRDFH